MTALLLFCSTPAPAQDDAPGNAAQKAEELENVRARIRDAKSSIEKARDQSESIMQELRTLETGAAKLSAAVDDLDGRIADKTGKLKELNAEREAQESMLRSERTRLAEQMRVAYKSGRHDFLKLLLNQEDPGLIGRMFAYHGYFSRARTENISRVETAVSKLDSLRASIETERSELEALRNAQLQKLAELKSVRASRESVIAKLSEYISSQDRQLQMLQRNEKELAALFTKLQKQESAVARFEDTPPFNSLRGKLQWPVRGDISVAFGAARKGGHLRSQGVTISVGSGTEVHAVGAGKVIFADWFRNLGLLLIIDHGSGFMSLYGHNERLLKKAGDWIEAGESIALTGDTGGQQQSGLYFEIRQNGAPVDPGLWCGG